MKKPGSTTKLPHLGSKAAVGVIAAATVETGHQAVNNALSGVTFCTDRGGTFEKSEPSPSAIVGCARMASRSLEYGRSASIAVCTAAMTSPASAPIIVKPRMRSSLPPTRTFMKPCVSPVVAARRDQDVAALDLLLTGGRAHANIDLFFGSAAHIEGLGRD